MKDSYNIIGDAVRNFWKQEGFATNVIVFFSQKYSDDKQWEQCQELAMCNSDTDFENVIFLSDFCEGQTEVANIHIVELDNVTDFYYKEIINKKYGESKCADCKHYGKLSLDCGRCDGDYSMFAPREREEGNE